MSVGQPLRVMNLYDVLTNLIPGIMVIGSIVAYFPIAVTVEVGLLIVIIGYLTGHVIQFIAHYYRMPRHSKTR